MCFDETHLPRASEFKTRRNKDFEMTTCQQVVDEYFLAQHFAFLPEGGSKGGWLILDPTCLLGTTQLTANWAKRFWAESDLWNNACIAEVNHRNRTITWWRAFADSSDFDDRTSFSKTMAGVRDPVEQYHEKTDTHDRFSIRDFADEFQEAFARCSKNKKLPEFVKNLKTMSMSIPDQVSSQTKKELSQLCR